MVDRPVVKELEAWQTTPGLLTADTQVDGDAVNTMEEVGREGNLKVSKFISSCPVL